MFDKVLMSRPKDLADCLPVHKNRVFFVSNNKTIKEPDDARLTIWTELCAPPKEELDTTQWAQYFQPLVQHSDHRGSVWAKVEGGYDVVILATWKQYTKRYRDSFH